MNNLVLPEIYPIVNISSDTYCSDLNYIKKLVNDNFKIIQIRSKNNKNLAEQFIIESLSFIKDNKKTSKIIVNDYVDLALKLGADGVHLGQDDTQIEQAREILGHNFIIGLSCHNLNDLKKAPVNILNYLALGPIFESETKNGHAPVVGLDILKSFSETSKLPVVAIGGINFDNLDQVLSAGAKSCAMVSAIKNKYLSF